MGCSDGQGGVDDDFVGVIMNYVCCVVLLCLGSHIWYKHGWIRGKVGILTEYSMALGYLTGGLVHHLFAERASSNDCANRYFYPIFCISYEGMVLSMWAWLHIAKQTRCTAIIRWFIIICAVAIGVGAVWCQFTVHLYSSNVDCGKGSQPMCDVTMGLGEGLFYAIWGVVWFAVAADTHRLCHGAWEKAANWLAPFFLALGPWQILLVSGLPIIFGGGPKDSLNLYCELRTGTTYILAVLFCHIFTVIVSDRIFSRSPLSTEALSVSLQQG